MSDDPMLQIPPSLLAVRMATRPTPRAEWRIEVALPDGSTVAFYVNQHQRDAIRDQAIGMETVTLPLDAALLGVGQSDIFDDALSAAMPGDRLVAS